MGNSRRDFILNTAYLALGFSGLRLYACSASEVLSTAARTTPAADTAVGYGPLVRDRRGVFDLPPNFSYRIISRQGDRMQDGLMVPGRADGMGTFAGSNGNVIIVRNHELSQSGDGQAAFPAGTAAQSGIDREDFFDFGNGKRPAVGGTTTISFDEANGRVVQQFLSLVGTNRNCAGGVTPWNTWLSCEEDVTLAGSYEGAAEVNHGFVFEVPATSEMKRAEPRPITAMGRFNHEAVAVDPNSGFVYLTEDRDDGLIYRFVPSRPGDMHAGGKLQALVVADSRSFDTRNWPGTSNSKMAMSTRLPIEWVDIDNVESPADDLRYQGASRGAAVFARGEGMWYGRGAVFFACTSGGKSKTGQVFKLVPGPDGDTLELFIEPNNSSILKYCDNLTVAPSGDVLLCEDDLDAYIRGVTPDGQIYTFGHNTGHRSEFAGICFSPSGKTMFVNIQIPGLTLAVTGPWKHL